MMAITENSNEIHMKSRSDFTAESHIKFPSSVTVDDFDKEIAPFYLKKRTRQPLLLDFAAAKYIDISVLFNLISLFKRRDEKGGLETFIGLSKDKKVRDFLRLWRFPKAFFDATRVQLKDVLVTDDQEYVGEGQSTYNGFGSGLNALIYDRDWVSSQGKRNFFEFTSYLSSPQQQSLFTHSKNAIPRLESERWNNSLVREVLTTHLFKRKASDDVARVVIYESISNAVRHPKADIIQTTSLFQSARYLGSPNMRAASAAGHLRIFVWDDGQAIVDTLEPLVRNNKAIRAVRLPYPYLYDAIYLQINEFGEESSINSVVQQDVDPPSNASEEEILLASLHPGITRTINQRVDEVDPLGGPSKPESPDWVKQQGMGLYALTKTALDSYQGRIQIRSGQHRLVLEIARDKIRKQNAVRYECRITRYPDRLPKFKGNLLTIELPIRVYE
jgi:hypothetical protein